MTTRIAKKLVLAAMAAAVLASGLATAAPAEAKPFQKLFPPKPFPSFHDHHGFGPAGVALIGGLAIGAIATAAAEQQEDSCYVVDKRVFDEDGNLYIRRFTVCE